ncbi:MAG TPA: peptidoglycan-binding domain-containing protein [Pseudolabrys sp.]|nr:peptidoglycan-binding domain-containing protein [Pseudolabrys sp.]
MKKILLASVATIALSFPALAAMNNNQSQNRQQNQTQSQNTQQGSQQRVSPKQLSKNEIRQIQQDLKQQGFNPQKVDGIWGPDTAKAVRQFQQKNNLNGNGQLNQQTLAKLGVNPQGQNAQNQQQHEGTVGAAPSSGTTGSDSNMNQPQQPNQPGSSQK